MRIYKQQLKEQNYQRVMLPEGSQIISVHDQLGVTCIWFICNPDNKLVERPIHIYITGQLVSDNISVLKFIGTTLSDDNIVLHVFEGDLP